MNDSERPAGPAVKRTGRTTVAAILLVLAVLGVSGAVWASSQGRTGSSNASSHSATTRSSVTNSTSAAPSVASAAPSDSRPAAEGSPSQPSAESSPRAAGAAEETSDAAGAAQLATVDQSVAATVPFDRSSSVAEGITADISAMKAVSGEARGPGEVSGPSLRFTVTIHNQTTTAISTANVVVNVGAGTDNIPAISLSGPGVLGFTDNILPGESGSGTYVYLVPLNERGTVRILVNFEVNSTIAAFEGVAPQTEGKP